MFIFDAIKSWLHGKPHKPKEVKVELSQEEIMMKEIESWLGLRSKNNIYRRVCRMKPGNIINKYYLDIIDESTARLEIRHSGYVMDFTFIDAGFPLSTVWVSKVSDTRHANILVLSVKYEEGKLKSTWEVENELWIKAIHSHLSNFVNELDMREEEILSNIQKKKDDEKKERERLEAEYLTALLQKY